LRCIEANGARAQPGRLRRAQIIPAAAAVAAEDDRLTRCGCVYFQIIGICAAKAAIGTEIDVAGRDCNQGRIDKAAKGGQAIGGDIGRLDRINGPRDGYRFAASNLHGISGHETVCLHGPLICANEDRTICVLHRSRGDIGIGTSRIGSCSKADQTVGDGQIAGHDADPAEHVE